MAVTEAGTRVKEATAGSSIVRPGRPPTTGIAATGNGFVEVLRASPTLVSISSDKVQDRSIAGKGHILTKATLNRVFVNIAQSSFQYLL